MCVTDGVRIGDHAVIGMGAVVTGDVPQWVGFLMFECCMNDARYGSHNQHDNPGVTTLPVGRHGREPGASDRRPAHVGEEARRG